MSMPDENIVTGRHGSDWWNEDSLEFYVNFTPDLDATSFRSGIHQVRIVPYDIGNTDPEAIVLSGSFAREVSPNAIVFATQDGWGFEASIEIPDGYEVAHGSAVGFQAHANGAELSDRNVKLIWSLRDADDDSWQNPSVFGTGVFYELGETTVPEPPARGSSEVVLEPPPKGLGVNLLGYEVGERMTAMFVDDSGEPLPWVARDEAGKVVASGMSEVWGTDRTVGGSVHHIDLAQLTVDTGRVVLEAGGLLSAPFSIGAPDYADLATEAMAYYYRNRSGVEILPEYAGGAWARPPGHLTDGDIGCFAGVDEAGRSWPGCEYRLDASGGWYDAGDYGKYVVNGGISVWSLMHMYERFGAFEDGTMAIPEAGNGIPDVLDEARWQMQFLLGMQVAEGHPMAGMAHHKLHDRLWAPLPSLPVTEEVNDPSTPAEGAGRYVYPPSTAATLNLAATGAQCARVIAPFDAEFASLCMAAAERAWRAAGVHPAEYTGSVPGSGGGPYHDGGTFDEWYWAASEMYATTGRTEFRDAMLESRFHGFVPLEGAAISWASTALLGAFTTAIAGDVDDALTHAASDTIIANADRLVDLAERGGFGVALDTYAWGSNADLLNHAMVLSLAADLDGSAVYRDTARQAVDYVLGVNPLGMSYVTGVDGPSPEYPHHRFWANRDEWPPPPPGVLVGGPNETADDPPSVDAGLRSLPTALRYIDHTESYSTNEVTINWNAPLAVMATWMATGDPATDGDATGASWGWIVAIVSIVAISGIGIAAVRSRQSVTGIDADSR